MPRDMASLRYLSALDPQAPAAAGARTGIVGVPFDGAVTYRSGARGGPGAIRAASDSIESYCPRFDRDLLEAPPVDFGDLDAAPLRSGREVVDTWRRHIDALPPVALLALGGDHLVALPFLERALERYPNLQIFHIDAHTDLRPEWDGEPCNHATVMRRVLDRMGADARLHPWGIRSGLREEFELARSDPRIELIANDLPSALDRLRRLKAADLPIYVTLDVDGIDPSEIPGTGTPEPGGLRYIDVETALVELARPTSARVVGADLVEVAPNLDPSGISAVAGARLARTLLLVLAAATAAN